jgi:hypothetical protein
MVKYSLYDCITDTYIDICEGSIIKQCKLMGIDNTLLPKMKPNKKRISCIASRYVLASDSNKCFTLVDYDTGKEYICATNESIFIHLNKPYDDNGAKYVYELKSGRQKRASICGKVFYLKGKNFDCVRMKPMKAESKRVYEEIQNRRLQTKIKLRLSHRIYTALLSIGKSKSDKTINMLGCDISYFMKYISLRFTNGMTFDNYGEWHIDHIIPCAKFDLTKQNDILKCFHFTNLQPIWKNNKIAIKYGESNNYIGNMQKSNKDIPIDYYLSNKIMEFAKTPDGEKYSKFITEKIAMDFSMDLVRNGAIFLPPK